MSNVTFQGNPVQTVGALPVLGAAAPAFAFVSTSLGVTTLADSAGKRRLISFVPSLDTPTCAVSTREFNQRAAALPNTQVLVVSADLPFAAKRFCAAEGLENVATLSTFREPGASAAWGVRIAEGALAGLTARAVFVVDEQDKVVYSELVSEITSEPNYDAALATLKN